MLNSIVTRNRMLNPFNDVEKKIIRSATKLFLQNGFSHTTLKMISNDCGLLQGRVAYYFHTKEDMLYILVQELMDFHTIAIEEMVKKGNDELLSYATEITAQIVLCENDKRAWDLYHSAYSLHGTYDFIKDWTSKKNHRLFASRLPEWDEKKFRIVENVASAIEFSALMSPCNAEFSIEDKITLVLDSLLRLYDVEQEEREQVLKKVFELDYHHIGQKMFESFICRLDGMK